MKIRKIEGITWGLVDHYAMELEKWDFTWDSISAVEIFISGFLRSSKISAVKIE